MTDHSPETLSDIEILDILQSMKSDVLNTEANEVIRSGGKAGRQEAHKQALVKLNQAFEDKFVEAVTLALGLNEGQSKKIRYKKDRIRMSQVAQAIVREDATVTHDLHNIFPFWKEGWPMVQFDNVYKILEDDIRIHYEAVLEALISKH